MVDGDTDKRATWAKIIQRRVEDGLPYIFFTDTVNNEAVDVYLDKGLRVNHSNLCLAPEPTILSDQGYEEIGKRAGEQVNEWQREEGAYVQIAKTEERKETARIV